MLGLIVTEHLYREYPDKSEGDLARIRSAVVSTAALAPIARSLGVGEALLLGRGEAASGGGAKASLLADALEAIIGAAFLDTGAEHAEALVLGLLHERLSVEARRRELGDAKNRLQELAARLSLPAPRYETASRGPDHERRFRTTVYVGERQGEGEGASRKSSERLAAEGAISALQRAGADSSPHV